MNKKIIISIVVLFIVLISDGLFIFADEKIEQPILQWLKLGPVESPLPIFHDVKNINGKTFDLAKMLAFEPIETEDLQPREAAELKWNRDLKLSWEKNLADSAAIIFLSEPNNATPQFCYLATYLSVTRWTKATLLVSSPHLFEIFVNGEKQTSKTSSEKPDAENKTNSSGEKTVSLKLETGSHLLLIKSLSDPQNNVPWQISAKIILDSLFAIDNLQLSDQPKKRMNLSLLLDPPMISSATISPDGELMGLALRQPLSNSDKSESWIEVRRTRDHKLVRTIRGAQKISSINWAPVGHKFSFTSLSEENNGKTIWLTDIDAGTTVPLLKNIQELGAHVWAPDESFIIYSVTEKPEKSPTHLKRLEGMPDRQPGWRNRSFLYLLRLPEKTRTRLTAGQLSTSLRDISPDGKRLLFSRNMIDYSQRPYSKTQFYLLDLQTMQVDSLFTRQWINNVQWSPDGESLLIQAGPSAFDRIGKNIPDDMIPNDYDQQLYIYHLKSGKVDPVTRDFNPSVNGAYWSKIDDLIYIQCSDRSYRHLYQFNVKTRKFSQIETNCEFIHSIDFAVQRSLAVYTGSGAAVPPKLFVLDLKKGKPAELGHPAEPDYDGVEFGKVKRWTFQNSRNQEIEGRIYFPPDFDETKKYPCIVYYYGGTTPVTRDFGGRYPKNLYAAHGYVVYVLQPSGAIGFGQQFSALHVNDWGKIVSDEIIDGVSQFLDAHQFVDRNRLGCIGASYGGFMTMLIQTKTDMFAAAIAHAGISMIPSYWGEGYWGYLYSAVATANSFPWNRRDIYVEQSPLFHADKISTPLLLLHGSADTNVPPGESIQLFTALKLLGKTVELIEVKDQNHTIMTHSYRKKWTKTILAWFDKWLKDQPQWWDDLYPTEN